MALIFVAIWFLFYCNPARVLFCLSEPCWWREVTQFHSELPECRTSHMELNQRCQVCLHLLQCQAALKNYEKLQGCVGVWGNIPSVGSSTWLVTWSSVQQRKFLKVGIAGKGSGHLKLNSYFWATYFFCKFLVSLVPSVKTLASFSLECLPVRWN